MLCPYTAKKTILESLKSGNIFYLYGFFCMSAQEKKIPLPISEINIHFSLPVLALKFPL